MRRLWGCELRQGLLVALYMLLYQEDKIIAILTTGYSSYMKTEACTMIHILALLVDFNNT